MSTRSGIAAQLGFKAESPWGTVATVDRFLPMLSESLTAKVGRLDSDSIYAGRLVRDSEQWDEGAIEAGGSVELDVYSFGMGLLWKHAIGAVNTTGSGPYTQTYTPGNLDGLGLTLQVGKPDRSGTVRPHNFVGCKCKGWELSLDGGGPGKVKFDYSAQTLDYDGTPALQSFSPPAGLARLVWHHASVMTVHGSSPKVKSVSFKGTNAIEEDRLFIGSQTIAEQDEVGLREYGGELEVEFGDETLLDAFWAGDEGDIVLTLARGSASLTVTTNARLDDGEPVVEGHGKLMQKIPFVSIGDGTDADALTLVTVNSDSAP